MNSDVLLQSHLKTLKLPTILQEYARAARQCAQQDRSFQEFLLYLVELEVAERHRKACERRLKQAGFPTVKEIAEWFSMKPSTIYGYAANSRIPCIRIGGRIRFIRDDVLRWIEARTEE